MTRQQQAIIWDWNGTLLDDIDVCHLSINRMLKGRQLPELTRERYREVFSFPVRDYYAAIGFDFTREAFEETAAEFIAHYTRSLPTCRLAEGAVEALAYFQKCGYQQTIISAMEHESLNESVRARGIAPYFDSICGLSNHYAASKINNAKRFFQENYLASDRVTLIGDTLHDAEVAETLGCCCILVASGHQSEERLIVTGHPVLASLEDVLAFVR
jgi:phosphoglycolate phosphatase